MLIWLIFIPLIAAALIGLVKLPGRVTALASATLSLALTMWALFNFADCPESWTRFCGEPMQFTLSLPLSQVMVLLSALVTFAAALGLRAPDARAERSWSICMLLISCGATGAFMSDSIIAFYAFHELALIPTFIMIGYYGRGDRRSIAWTATLYLGLASMVLLVGLVLLCMQTGAWSFSSLKMVMEQGMMPATPALIGALLLVGFGALVSLFPLHSWAGPAYASAPTPIAMLHAGVLKKFGLYGLFTLAAAFGPACEAIFGAWNNVLLFCLLGNILWVGYVTISKTRLDDMLGYSSVMHMGYLFLGFAAFVACGGHNELAFKGSAVLMLAHGLSIGMLFLLAGQIESQTRTLELDSMGGLAAKLPVLGFFFGLAGMASIGLPLLANFPGEFSVFVSCFHGWVPTELPNACCWMTQPITWLAQLFGGLGPVQVATLFALWGLVIGAIYMLRAFRNIFEGPTDLASTRATKLSTTDICSAAFLAALLVIFGLCPFLVTSLIG